MKKFLRSLVLIFVLLVSATGFLACDCGAPAIETITLGENPEYFEVGQEYTYTVTLTPTKASKDDLVWTSSNPNVATVNEKGKVVGRSAGTTIITAMSKKNSNVKDFTELLVRGTSEVVILLDKNFTYDGTQKSIVASSAPSGLELRYTYEGVNISYPESETAPINVGEYKVKAKERMSGTVMAQATLRINKKVAYITIGDYTKRYSEEDPVFGAAVTGLVGEDSISYTLSRASGESVGTYRIDANYAPAPNYEVKVSPGILTINQLDVKIEVDGKTSVYGDALQPLTYTIKTPDNYILDHVMVTSQVTGNLVLEYDGDKGRIPYGSYAISPVQLTSTNLNIISKTPGTYNITKRTAIISIAADQYKYAGEADPALRYGIEGTLEGDNLQGCLTRLEGEIVGFYDYIISQSINLNYTITTDVAATLYRFEIKSNVVNIDFNDFEINYSAANAEDFIPEDKYKYTITLNDEPIDYTINAEGKVFINQTDAIILSHEVTKELHMSDEEKAVYYQKWKVVPDKVDVSGYVDPAKYTFNFGEGYKYLKLIGLTVFADPATRIYGDSDPELTYTVEGLLDGDTVESVIEKVELKRATGENVGSYAITLKDDIELKDGKTYYTVSYVPSSLVVIARELFITPLSYTVDNPVYYGEADKPLEIDTSYTNIATRDTLNAIISGELSRPAINEVGVYDILDNKLKLTSNNYYLTYTKGVYTIVPRPITVTAINRTLQYGETVAKYDYSVQIVDEFVYNAGTEDEYTEVKPFSSDYDQPTINGKLALTTFGTLYAGNTYTIGKGTISAGKNFDITFNTGTLTIVPRDITIAFKAESFGFLEYQEQNPTPSYSFTPKLAYADKSVLSYYGTKTDTTSNIVSLNKIEGEEEYALQINFVNSEGTIINDCYNLTIDENYIELFYLGESTFDITISGMDGNQTVIKDFGQKYAILDTFKITWDNPNYDVQWTEDAFNIKGITDTDTKTTPASTTFNAGAYTVAVFNDKISIIDGENSNVARNFALNIKSYGSLVINKVNLTVTSDPSANTIVYGTERPTFIGGTYTFTDEDGNEISILGSDHEYSTANTASYPVQEAKHSIMVTFNPDNQNFNSIVHSGVQLRVIKKWVDTSVLEWAYGASVENLGTLDGDTYTTWANLADVTNITYNGAYTAENEYYVPNSLANATFLNKNLQRQHFYYGVQFHDDGDDTGFMYYIDGTEVKKVFPAEKDSFYSVYNKATNELQLYYNDGVVDYLLTNSATIGADNKPVYFQSAYSPSISGIYFTSVTISSANPNYAVSIENGFITNDDPIVYYNTFLVNKVIVAVYNFTSEITYGQPVEFYYITDPEEVFGIVTKYWKKTAEPDVYEEMPAGEIPENVGSYAATFLIDKQNHYYYKDFYYFEIKPIEIVVEWGEYASFDFLSTDSSVTRPFVVKAAGEVVYDTSNRALTPPDWLEISYSGRTNMGWAFPTNIPTEYQGLIPEDIPSFAGEYTIIVSTKPALDGSRNYTGEERATYKINPRLYGGNISLKTGRLTYDIGYNGNGPGSYTGAQKYYQDLKGTMLEYGGEDPDDYNLVLSYNGTEIRPDGINYQIIETNLNQAGGPYRITLIISSVDGNIKETVKTGSLYVYKADIPEMASYAPRKIDIPYSGVQEFNPLKSADLSVAYTPTEVIINNVENTYSYVYQHLGNKDVYFGITYTYYLVLTSTSTTGLRTEAPRTPDDGGENIFMVVATIEAGANYNDPDPGKAEYRGYFKVVRTKVTMQADNITVTYTGERFDLPEVVVRNTDSAPVTIKYDPAGTEGVYVERTIKRGPTTTSRIDVVGVYTVTFKLDNSEGFFLSGSVFETTCTVTVLAKKIDGLDKFIKQPDPFVATEIKGKFSIDKAKAKAHDANYTDNMGTMAYIQLFITDSPDGTGTTWGPVENNSKFLDELPAGTYYYYVAVQSGATSKIKNYTNSDYVQFVITRKPITIEIDAAHRDGITINYAAGATIAYDISYIIAKKDGTSLNTLVLSDYKIEYKLTTEPDTAYTTDAPYQNGTYDVKIQCLSDYYESNIVTTTMIIDAPTLNISGSISFTYGQLNNTLNIDLTATGTNYTDSLIESKTDTIATAAGDMDFYDYTPETPKGHWFILKNDFGIDAMGTNIPNDYELMKGEDLFIDRFGAEVNNLLDARGATLQTRNALGQFTAGNHTIWVIYVSYDSGFAISCAEIPVSVATYQINNTMIAINNDVKYSVVDSKGTFNTTVKFGADSVYDVSDPANPKWAYENINVVNTVEFSPTITYIALNDNKQPVEKSETIDCSALINGTLTTANIVDYFADSSKKTTLNAGSLSLNNINYTFASDIRFILYAEYEKQVATAFSNKLAPNGMLAELEVAYGKVFLDGYWLNLFDKTEASTTYPDKLADSDNHIYLYNLINIPMTVDSNTIANMRSAWPTQSGRWYQYYTMTVYRYLGINHDGSVNYDTTPITSTKTYDRNNNERGGAYQFYTYDINPDTDAGQYYIVIKLHASNYFLETTLEALVRVKPSTYIAMTSTDATEGMITSTTETIKAYLKQADGSYKASTQNYKISYYYTPSGGTERLAYESYYKHSDGSYTSTNNANAEFSTFANMVNNNGASLFTRKYTVRITPDNTNSMYVEDSEVIVVGSYIDLGQYNIYDQMLLGEKQEGATEGLVNTNPDLSALADIGTLSWAGILGPIFEKTGDTLTEEALSIIYYMDQNLTASGSPGSYYYSFNVRPDANYQLAFTNVPLYLGLEDGSNLTITLRFKVNMKLVSIIDNNAFVYDGTQKIPNVKAYFQAWEVYVQGFSQTGSSMILPNIETIQIKEIAPSSYYYDGAPVNPTFFNAESGNPVAAPIDAGTYRMETTYTISFGGTSAEFKCTNSFNINKVKTTVSITSQDFIYNNQPKALEANAGGLSVTITYYSTKTGEVVASPKNAGVYRAVAEVSDDNYFGTAVGILTIKPTFATIVITDPANLEYTGSSITPTYKIYNENNDDITDGVTVTKTYNGSSNNPVKAGTYILKIEIGENDNCLPLTVQYEYIIRKATAVVTFTEPASYVYSGSEIGPDPVIPTDVRTYATTTYNGSTTKPKDAGVYEVYVNINPPANSDYLASSYSMTYMILPKAFTISYDGKNPSEIIKLNYSASQSATSLNYSCETGANVVFEYEGYKYNSDGTLSDVLYKSTTFPDTAGVYTITAKPGSSNYEGTFITSLIINRVTPTMSFILPANLVFSDSKKVVTVETTPSVECTVVYTGASYDGVPYNDIEAPKKAGTYVVTATFAGNENYFPIEGSRSFDIEKQPGATIEFKTDSLEKIYNTNPQSPEAVVKIGGIEVSALSSQIKYMFGSYADAPTNAGVYTVIATLTNCNYSAAPATTNFTITKTNNYTITPIADGNLSIGATSAATLDINSEAYEILYVGKTYKSNGDLYDYDNYRGILFPGVAGEYVGTIISDNYAPKTFTFKILKTDISSSIALSNYTITYGTNLTLAPTVTVGPDTFNVKYMFKAAGESEYTDVMPTMIGEHSIKMFVCAANTQGEKIATLTINHSGAASKVVMAPYVMYDSGNNIIPEAHLYLNSILQTNPERAYYKDGSVVSYVRDVGEYTIQLYVSEAHKYSANFTVVPKITFKDMPLAGTTYTGAEYLISYQFESDSDRIAHESNIELLLFKDGKILTNTIARNAGEYTAVITYNEYTIRKENFTIGKKLVEPATPDRVNASVDDYSSIPTVLPGGYEVEYEIQINKTGDFKRILPPVGEHNIKYIIISENHTGAVIGVINVARQSLQLNIADFSVAYTGADLVMPDSLASFEELSYRYVSASSPTATPIAGLPRNVGDYHITVYSSSDTYLIKYPDLARPYIAVSITKAVPEYIVSDLTQVYDGTAKAPTYTALYNGQSLTINISRTEMINAGEYEVFFSVAGNDNYEISSTYTFIIEKADANITYTLPRDLTYNGSIKTDYDASVSETEVGDVSIEIKKDGSVVPIKDAGRYTMTLTTAESTNYKAATKVVIFNILPARTPVECFVIDHNYQYNGSAKSVVVNTDPIETNKEILYDGSPDAPTNAGTYTAVITVTPTDPNYSTEVITYKYTIVPVVDEITYSGAPNGYFYYDGNPKALTDLDSSSGATVTAVYEKLKADGVSYEEITNLTTLTDEGNYRVTLTSPGNTNYYATSKIVYFSIFKELLAASISSNIVEYDGSQKNVNLSETHGKGAGLVKITYQGFKYAANGKCTEAYDSDTAPTEAGYYTATLTSTNSNYVIGGNASAKLIIKRRVSNITVKITGIADDAVIVEYTGVTYDVNATASTKDGNVAVNTLDSDALMIRLVGTETNTTLNGGGSYEIIVDLQGKNYIGHYKRLLTIKPQDATIFVKQTAVEFTGAANSLVYTILDKSGNDITETVKDDVLIIYSKTENGTSVTPIEVGDYYANIVLTSSSYVGTATYKFKIVKTRPNVEYRPDGGSPVILSTSVNTELDSFNVDRYSFKFNGVTVTTSEYVVEILSKQYEDITPDDGINNEVAVWKKCEIPADKIIKDPNNYKVSITLIAKDLYKNNLEYNPDTHDIPQFKACDDGTHSSCPGHIVYEFLFGILPH